MINQLIQCPEKLKVLREEDAFLVLSRGFSKVDFGRGVRTLAKLGKVYSDLQFVLKGGTTSSLVDTKRIGSLTKDVYSQGISRLTKLLDIVERPGGDNQSELTKESAKLEEDLRNCEDTSSPLYSLIQERLSRNARMVGLVKTARDKIDELLCHVELCTDSLREISLELPELVSHESKSDFNEVLRELNSRVEFAQRVKSEYDRQGI